MFQLNSLVEAKSSVQGMVKGQLYRVISLDRRYTGWGTYTTLRLVPGPLVVVNADIVLKLVK